MSSGLAVTAVLISGISCVGQSPSSAAKPFVLFEEEQVYGPKSSQPHHTFNRIVARRADGSRMEAHSGTSPEGEPAWSVTIWDVPNGKRMVLEPFTASVSTWHLSSAQMASELESGTCSAAKSGVSGDTKFTAVLGYKVVAFIDPEVGGDDGFHRESWIAHELDCYPLRMSERWSKDGSRNEFRVTKVDEGEPPPDLFVVPPDYQERSPGEVEAIFMARYGEGYYGNAAAQLNSDYYSHR